jgi:hypothetical protein
LAINNRARANTVEERFRERQSTAQDYAYTIHHCVSVTMHSGTLPEIFLTVLVLASKGKIQIQTLGANMMI